jgi:hypothetical protein
MTHARYPHYYVRIGEDDEGVPTYAAEHGEDRRGQSIRLYDREAADKLASDRGGEVEVVEKLDPFTATMICEGVEEADTIRLTQAWQQIIDDGSAFRLQGSFGRKAWSLDQAGLVRVNHPD